MAEEPFMSFQFDTGDHNPTDIDPGKLDQVPRIIMEEIKREMDRVAEALVDKLRERYWTEIPTRTRLEASYLRERLSGALVSVVSNLHDDVEVGVFDLEHMQRVTSTDDDLSPKRDRGNFHGWFELFEDGHEGLDHGSEGWFAYGFIKLEDAKELAEQCIVQLSISPEDAASFRQFVNDAFRGRHGEGIMVRVDKPLFFKYREFGTAGEHGVKPHPGFEAWNILGTTSFGDSVGVGAAAQGLGYLVASINIAMARAAQRIKRELR